MIIQCHSHLDYGLDKLVTSKQTFANMMIYHRTKEVCIVNNTKSSDLEMSLRKPSATFIKFLGQ